MSIRQPKLRAQAALLRDHLAKKGLSTSVGESLELVAHLNGFSSWNVAKHAERAPGSARNTKFPVQIWTATYGHRHGEDVFTFTSAPSREDVIACIEAAGSEFTPSDGEWIEIGGVETLTIDLPRQLMEQAKSQLPNVCQVYEVNMTDFLDYETPDDVAEWQWIRDLAGFQHTGNGTAAGVWEFMVHASKLREAQASDTVPALLAHEVNKALSLNVAWVMFHQG